MFHFFGYIFHNSSISRKFGGKNYTQRALSNTTYLHMYVTFPTKVHLVKAMVFPVVIYGCESWTIKKAERRRMEVLEKTLENPLDCKEIQPVNPKGNQS